MSFMRLPSCPLCSMVQFVESMVLECLGRWISRRLRWRTLATHSQFNNDSSCSQILSASSTFWTKGEHQQCRHPLKNHSHAESRSSFPMQPWWKSSSHHPKLSTTPPLGTHESDHLHRQKPKHRCAGTNLRCIPVVMR